MTVIVLKWWIEMLEITKVFVEVREKKEIEASKKQLL